MKLTHVDWLIMLLYFVFVLGIGSCPQALHEDEQRLLPGGARAAGVDLRASLYQRQPGRAGSDRPMGASGAKYGLETAHFYGIGAIPAMVFVGIFMMPFYYGSKARSVPEYSAHALR